MMVFPALAGTGFGVVDHPVLAVAKRLHEGAMAHTPDLLGLAKNRAMLDPAERVEYVLALVLEQSQAAIRTPVAAGRVDNENVPVPLQHLRRLADRHGYAFPALLGRADQRSGAADGCRVFQAGRIKVLLAVASPRPAGPDQILAPVVQGQHRSINRPAASLQPSATAVSALRIRAIGLQHPHTALLIAPVIGGIIDEPFAINQVQFRSP